MNERPLIRLRPQPFNVGEVRLFRIAPIEVLEGVIQRGELCPPASNDISAYQQYQLAKPNMINKRSHRKVEVAPGGSLHDYVSFYFAPRSPMLYSIYKGNADGVRYNQEDIVYFVTKIKNIFKYKYVYTDRNALLDYAEFTSDLDQLHHFVDFDLMEARLWRNADEDRSRVERRMAEFLVHGCIALEAMSGIAVFDAHRKARVEKLLRVDTLPCKVYRDWYF